MADQKTLVRETSSMLFYSSNNEPVLSVAGVWSAAGSHVVCTVDTEVGFTDDEIDRMNHEINDVVTRYLNSSPKLVRFHHTQSVS